jgi:hypothetical protein
VPRGFLWAGRGPAAANATSVPPGYFAYPRFHGLIRMPSAAARGLAVRQKTKADLRCTRGDRRAAEPPFPGFADAPDSLLRPTRRVMAHQPHEPLGVVRGSLQQNRQLVAANFIARTHLPPSCSSPANTCSPRARMRLIAVFAHVQPLASLLLGLGAPRHAVFELLGLQQFAVVLCVVASVGQHAAAGVG